MSAANIGGIVPMFFQSQKSKLFTKTSPLNGFQSKGSFYSSRIKNPKYQLNNKGFFGTFA